MEISKFDIEDWVSSKESTLVQQTLRAILHYQHGSPLELAEIYGQELIDRLPEFGYGTLCEYFQVIRSGLIPYPKQIQSERLAELESRMPVSDIRHSYFFAIPGRLILSDPGTYLLPRAAAIEDRVRQEAGGFETHHRLLGLTARINSNGWRIFHAAYPHTESTIKLCSEVLPRRGYILMLNHRVRGFEPRFPTEEFDS